MNDVTTYSAERVRYWVWSGFYTASEVEELLAQLIEHEGSEAGAELNAAELWAQLDQEWAAKSAAEADWPDRTDCDRLDEAFDQLESEGICCVHNAGHSVSDGFTEVAEALHERGSENFYGYCFYSGHEIEHALDGAGLWLTFGDLNDNAERAYAVGRKVLSALVDAGLEPEWDGKPQSRVWLPELTWQRWTRRDFFAAEM
ncbi:DUF6891 domain-containing protein [Chitinimonas lacunae]|uniref:DUF6891 domain-containing protein n=1 Tax=Chitinimonas lacunae TaxID=1963018 RepID=A0ABV8MQD4_9NEIS